MTQINLPNQSITGANLWSQVEDNDQAIADVVNGNIDDGNIAASADIDGAKLLAASVDTTQLASGAVTNAKLNLTTTTATITFEVGYSASTSTTNRSPFRVVKGADGLVTIQGAITKTSAWTLDGLVATFPVGFRPTGTINLLTTTDLGQDPASFELRANGELRSKDNPNSLHQSFICASFYPA